jgi:hypothetical protein
MNDIRILSPCGMLGYGFPQESFLTGMERNPHAIVVDAGSTDAGPHKLGSGVAIVSRRAAKKDLELLLTHGIPRKIPILIGSAGGAGARKHVEWTLDIVQEIMKEHQLHAKLATIWADFSQETIIEALREGKVTPLGKRVPPLTEEAVADTPSIVAQMGHEPIVKCLSEGYDIMICGRAYDPAPFAAVGIHHGKDAALAYHLGKILECGALCAEPGTTKDCILGTLKENSFTVESLNPNRRCTETSVAAHTFYEKEHPYLLPGPGFILDLKDCLFKEIEPGIVEVKQSRLVPNETYSVKLEGARKIAYRTFGIAGVRDPLLLSMLDEVEKAVKEQVENYYQDISKEDFQIHFYNYGKDGVLGKREPNPFTGHEVGIVFEVIAKTQELASSICATVRSTFLHYGYEGRKSTAGNLAFPFAPSEVEFGPVYEFSIYHLLKIEDPLKVFRIEEAGGWL